MREIKFRAYGPTGMTFFDNEQAAQDQYIAQHLMLLMANNHPQGKDLLMQYTGLQDKDGVEIYEGDIVRVPYNRIGNRTVEFTNGGYEIANYALSACYLIGNIHENPELLEAAA